LKKKRTRN